MGLYHNIPVVLLFCNFAKMLPLGEPGQCAQAISVLGLRTACESIVILISAQLKLTDKLLRINDDRR